MKVVLRERIFRANLLFVILWYNNNVSDSGNRAIYLLNFDISASHLKYLKCLHELELSIWYV